MKKLVLTFAAIGLFFATPAQAQVENETSTEVTQEIQDQEKEYEQVEVTELPDAVTMAVNRDYPGAVTNEAHVKEKDGKSVYKLKLLVNGEEQKVYVDSEGNWIDKDEKKDHKTEEY